MCRQRILPAISVNKGCSHQAISHCTLLHAPEGNSGWTKKKYNRIQALDSYIKGIISMNPDSWLFSPCRKALKLLTWDVCFFVIKNNLLMSEYMFCFIFPQQKLQILVPPLPLWIVSQSYLHGYIPASQSSEIPQIKHNSQFLGCAFFSVEKPHCPFNIK